MNELRFLLGSVREQAEALQGFVLTRAEIIEADRRLRPVFNTLGAEIALNASYRLLGDLRALERSLELDARAERAPAAPCQR